MEMVKKSRKLYFRPMVVDHRPIRFETAHSWNKGKGTRPAVSNGNNGIHYPNPPYTGPRNGNDGTNGQGNGPKKWKNG